MPASSEPTARILLVGDLILDEPDPDFFFEPSAPVLREGDVVIGQVEVPHSRRGHVQSTDVPARPSDPANLEALPRAGITVATLAGNHIGDAGPEAIEDTVASLRELGIETCGAGMNIAEARLPAIVEANGVRVGVLSYNCVGPRDGWARASKAGCAYLEILTHYELDHAAPGGPPTIYTFATPQSLDDMRDDLAKLRKQVDVVVVAFHKGLGHVRAQLAMYEREIARAAVDAGADVVVGHHAHIMRGIELYKGKPIYHGLGNFVTVTRALSPTNTDTPEAAAWAKRRLELFGFAPDPSMPTYPFHPESRSTIIADCRVGKDSSVDAGLVPCYIDDDARPVPLDHFGGESVVSYLIQIGVEAGLSAEFEWDGGRVFVRESANGDARRRARRPRKAAR